MNLSKRGDDDLDLGSMSSFSDGSVLSVNEEATINSSTTLERLKAAYGKDRHTEQHQLIPEASAPAPLPPLSSPATMSKEINTDAAAIPVVAAPPAVTTALAPLVDPGLGLGLGYSTTTPAPSATVSPAPSTPLSVAEKLRARLQRIQTGVGPVETASMAPATSTSSAPRMVPVVKEEMDKVQRQVESSLTVPSSSSSSVASAVNDAGGKAPSSVALTNDDEANLNESLSRKPSDVYSVPLDSLRLEEGHKRVATVLLKGGVTGEVNNGLSNGTGSIKTVTSERVTNNREGESAMHLADPDPDPQPQPQPLGTAPITATATAEFVDSPVTTESTTSPAIVGPPSLTPALPLPNSVTKSLRDTVVTKSLECASQDVAVIRLLSEEERKEAMLEEVRTQVLHLKSTEAEMTQSLQDLRAKVKSNGAEMAVLAVESNSLVLQVDEVTKKLRKSVEVLGVGQKEEREREKFMSDSLQQLRDNSVSDAKCDVQLEQVAAAMEKVNAEMSEARLTSPHVASSKEIRRIRERLELEQKEAEREWMEWRGHLVAMRDCRARDSQINRERIHNLLAQLGMSTEELLKGSGISVLESQDTEDDLHLLPSLLDLIGNETKGNQQRGNADLHNEYSHLVSLCSNAAEENRKKYAQIQKVLSLSS